MSAIQVVVDLQKPQKHFNHFFNAVGYANVDYTYTAPSRKMYEYLSSFHNHFKYMRLHNILTAHGKGDYYLLEKREDYGNPPGWEFYSKGGDAVVSLDANENLCYNWTVVDKVYDILVEHDICPIVETVYMPHCLQKDSEHSSIPKDYNLWKKMLADFALHLQERYGREEIEQWYFEVWNEPDNHSYWNENPESFFALYDYMESAIHSVNPNLKVGGPAVKQGKEAKTIFEAFLSHCAGGVNYADGTFGTRIDFISVHCKGGWPDGYNPSTDVMFNDVKDFLNILKEYPEFEGIEFFNDESDVVWNGNIGVCGKSWFNFRNTHYFPGFVCKMVNTYCNIVEDEYGVNLSIVDSDNCHIQWERYLFSGNRSQFTPLVQYPSADLIKKPIFNAYVLLSRLGNQRLTVECPDEGFGIKFGVLPTIDENVLSMMVWNFEDGMEDDVNHRTIHLALENLPFRGEYRLIHYRIDQSHSSSYHIWREMGKPDRPSIEQIKAIRAGEGLALYGPVQQVQLHEKWEMELDMPMHAVSLLMLVPKNQEKPGKVQFIKGVEEYGSNKNLQIFIKWTPQQEKDFLYYRLWRKRDDEQEYAVISDHHSMNTAVYVDMDVEKGHHYEYTVQAVNASMNESEFSDSLSVCVK